MAERERNVQRQKDDPPIYPTSTVTEWARRYGARTIRAKTPEELEAAEKGGESLQKIIEMLVEKGIEITPELIATLTGDQPQQPEPIEPEPQPKEIKQVATKDIPTTDLLKDIEMYSDKIIANIGKMKRGMLVVGGVSVSDDAVNCAAHIKTLTGIISGRLQEEAEVIKAEPEKVAAAKPTTTKGSGGTTKKAG